MFKSNFLCINLNFNNPYVVAVIFFILTVIISAIISVKYNWLNDYIKRYSKKYLNLNKNEKIRRNDLHSIFRVMPGIVILVLMISYIFHNYSSISNTIWQLFKVINDVLPICSIWVSIYYIIKGTLRKFKYNKCIFYVGIVVLIAITYFYMMSVIN